MFDPLSVIVYGLCQLFPILLLAPLPPSTKRARLGLYLLAFAPICVFAALRGNVGTDTQVYRDNFDALTSASSIGLDPLFYQFEWAFKLTGLGVQAFLAGEAIFCWVLFSVGAARVDQKLPVITIGLLPVLLLDATFNGLRYGMAFAVTLAIISGLDSRKGIVRVLLSLLPGLFHSSMLVLLLLRTRIIWAVGTIVGVVVLLYVERFNPIVVYLSYKYAAYDVTQRPSWFSGLFPLFQLMMLYCVAKFAKCSFKDRPDLLTLSVIVILTGIGTSYMSSAGLRILQIGVFLFAIWVSSSAAKVTQSARVTIVLMGLSGVLNFWRQIFLTGPAGSVLFVPYHFF